LALQSILHKSENLRSQLSLHRSQQIKVVLKLANYFSFTLNFKDEEVRRKQMAQKEFHSVTQNLHHLVSTKVTPGIYNTPYFQDEVPTAFGVPIEDHLRTVRTYL
jgi:hypothetical protein